MRKNLGRVFAALALSMLVFGGCAKDQVKPDTGLATQPPAKAGPAVAEPAKPEAPKAPLAEPLKEQQIKDDEAAGLARQAQASASELQAAEAARRALARIYFDYDSYALSQTARDTLYTNAEYLLKKYKGRVRLEGHCDERGSDEYNLALGENRAKTAMNYLVTLGVPAEQLSIVSFGKERPLDPGHDEAAWAKNRRVEFDIVK